MQIKKMGRVFILILSLFFGYFINIFRTVFKLQFLQSLKSRNVVYRYGSKLRRRWSAAGIALIIGLYIFSLAPPTFITYETGRAVSDTARPDTDIQTDWTNCTNSCTNHYTEIDESTYDGNDYANAGGSASDGDLEHFGMTSVAGSTLNVTQVDVTVYSWINGACQGSGGNCDTLTVNISIDGSTTNSNEGAQTYTLGTTADDSQTFNFTPTTTWTGDDDLEVIITHNVAGGGPGASRDDDVFLAYIDAVVTFDVNIDQEHFQWRLDEVGLNTDTYLLAEDTKPNSDDTQIGSVLRLRIEIDNSGTAGTANVGYRLQWAVKGGGACSAASGWTRVDTASDDWAMAASAQYADGDAITSSHLTGGEPTFVNGEGLDTDSSGDDTSANIQLDPDDYTEVEWAIEATSNATEGETYCFRAVDSSGGTLNTYNVYPEITLRTTTHEQLTLADYIWENDDDDGADSDVDDGTIQQNGNTAITSVRKGERIALRAHIDNTGNRPLDSNLALFYDRNDGMWTKVQSFVNTNTAAGDCTDTDFECTDIDVTDDIGSGTDIAIGPDGRPWISYWDTTNDDAMVAEFVGSGGTGCDGGSTEWTCQLVNNDTNGGDLRTTIAIAGDGTPWVGFSDHVSLTAFQDTVCSRSSGTWTCENLSTSDRGYYMSIAVDNNDVPWISYNQDNSNELLVASRDGGGSGSCATDTDWNCETVDTTGSDAIGEYTSIAIDPEGVPWVSYYDGGTESSLKVASRDGDGSGSCSDTDWNCETVDNTGTDTGSYTSIAFNSDGFPWVSYYDTTNSALRVAHRETSGFGSACTDSDWRCGAVDSTGTVGLHTSIAFAPDGNAWITYFDDDATADNKALKYVRHVGSGGSGCADAAWDGCADLDSTGTDAIGEFSSIAFSNDGNAWISYYDGGADDNLKVATLNRAGEITISSSVANEHGDIIEQSHADSTGGTKDTTLDDCISASTTWNDGILIETEEVSSADITLPVGDSTAQCTELQWTIDTSQAQINTTYRFVIATEDGWAQSKSKWRGPIAVDNYPTLTIENATSSRFSKGLIPTSTTDCSAFTDSSGGSANWGCEVLIDGDDASDFDQASAITFSPEGVPYILATDQDENTGGTLGNNLVLATYVGSSGSCVDFTDTGTVGSAAWDCEVIIDGDDGAVNNDFYANASLEFSPNGTPYILATDYNEASGGTTGGNLVLATYVGSGGSCVGFADSSGGSAAWDCEVIIDGDDTFDFYTSSRLAFNPAGEPYIIATDRGEATGGTTGANLILATYVGSGGNCDGFTDTSGGSDAWECEVIIDGESDNDFYFHANLTFSPDGMPYILTHDRFENSGTTQGNNLILATYVGDGGSCVGFTDSSGGSDAWDCEVIIDGDSNSDFWNRSYLKFSPDGTPTILTSDDNESSGGTAGDNLVMATYVGGSSGSCYNFTDTGNVGSQEWDCEVILDGDDTSDFYLNLSFQYSPNGTAHIWASDRDENTGGTLGSNLIHAYYVGSGGNCSNFTDSSGGSNAWQCEIIIDGDDDNDFYSHLVSAFSPNGVQYMVTTDTDENTGGALGGNLVLARMDLPPDQPSGEITNNLGSGNAGTGDLQYSLDLGKSLRTDADGTCDSTSNIRGYCGIDDGDSTNLDGITAGANEVPMMAFAIAGTGEGVQWIGETTVSAATNNIYLQLYDTTTNAWTTVDTCSTGTSCTLSGISSSFSESVDGTTFSYARVYQDAHTTTQTLRTDAIALLEPPKITQEGYIWENDDGSTADDNSQQHFGNQPITGVVKGERVTLRTQLEHAGSGASSSGAEYSLFYDRGDGLWSKVKNQATLFESPTSGEDCEGLVDSGGSTQHFCEVVLDGDSTSDFRGNISIATDAEGRPWFSATEHGVGGDGELIIGRYVGSGGNCAGFEDSGGSDAWSCEMVLDGTATDDFRYWSELSFDPDGTPWFVTANQDSIMAGKYVGSGGNCNTFENGGSTAWDCWELNGGSVVNLDDYQYSGGIDFDSLGNPWIVGSEREVLNTNGQNIVVMNYVGSGGNCIGSSEWQCETVIDGSETTDFRFESKIILDDTDTPWIISYESVIFDGEVIVAKYVGSGGDCDGFVDLGGSDAWDCEKPFDTVIDPSNDTLDITVDGNGDPWVIFNSDTNKELTVANYVGSSGNCDGFFGAGGSDAWQCEKVVDDNGSVLTAEIQISPGGDPIFFATDRNSSLNTTGGMLYSAIYVGGGNGDCQGFIDSGGSNDWDCEVILDGDDVTDFEEQSEFTIDNNGDIWFSTTAYNETLNTTGNNLIIGRLDRGGEITLSPGLAAAQDDAISESHADMDAIPDNTDRDDADCLSGSTTWNAGLWTNLEETDGISIDPGSNSAGCTEVAWVLDTSQAQLGTTYRFVVATKYAWNPDKGAFRGPVSITEYPTLTISNKLPNRYSKTATASFTDCDDTAWDCETVAVIGSLSDSQSGIDIDNNDQPWLVYKDEDNDNLLFASYLGSSGDCDTLESGSDGWDCDTIDSSAAVGDNPKIVFDDARGTAWVAYYDTTNTGLKVANYVGSGGNCTSTAWSCELIHSTSSPGADDIDITIDNNGNPRIAASLSGSLLDAVYVGSGGNCGNSAAWECTTVDGNVSATVGVDVSIAISPDNTPYISHYDSTNDNLLVSYYVGAGGNCDDTAGSDGWQCDTVDSSASTLRGITSISFNSSGNPSISYYNSGNDIGFAEFVGGATGDCTDTDWECTTVANPSADSTRHAYDSDGNAWIAFDNVTSVGVAKYVGSGGNCDTTMSGSDAWECTASIKSYGAGHGPTGQGIAFDSSGVPWISSIVPDTLGNDDIVVAKLKVPGAKTTAENINSVHTHNAGSGDLRHLLDWGSNPRDSGADCGPDSETNFAGYCGVERADGVYDSIVTTANERPLMNFTLNVDQNTEFPDIDWVGRTDVAPNTASTAGDLHLEIYRFGTTNAWVSLATDTTSSDCSTADCALSGTATGTESDYYESDGQGGYWVHVRVYQESHTTAINFRTDVLNYIDRTTEQLRFGNSVIDGVESGFDLRSEN
jgi:hypothetical protein